MTNSGSYLLANDLDFSSSEYSPMFTTAPFTGIFDGNNHQLIGIHFTQDSHSTVDTGIFGYTQNAVIKNLILNDVHLTLDGDPNASSSIGLLSGNDIQSTFSNIELIHTSIITADTIPFYVGGLVGNSNSSSFTDIKGSFKYEGDAQYTGGLVGISSTTSQTYRNIALTLDFSLGNISGGLMGGVFQLGSTTLTLDHVSIRGTLASPNYAGSLFGAATLNSLILNDVTTAVKLVAQPGTNPSVFSGAVADNQISLAQASQFFSQNSFDNTVSQTLLGTPNAFLDEAATSITCTDCFYVSNLGLTHSSLSALSATQAQDGLNFSNYDFSSDWIIHPKLNDGKPYLRYGLVILDFEENGGNLLDPQPYFPYEAIPTPLTTSRSGYTFEGWFSDSTLTQVFDFNSTHHSTSQTLYAKWVAITPTPVPTPEAPIIVTEPIPNTGVSHHDILLLIFGLTTLFVSTFTIKTKG